MIYAALGRIRDAKSWLAHAGEGMGYDYAGCNIADAEGDYGRFLYYLRHLEDRDKTNAQVVAVFAQLHQISEAERLFQKLQKQPGFSSAEAHWIRGELARANGKVDQATTELKAGVTAFTVSDDALKHNELLLPAESLADILEAQGDKEGAIAVLEPLATLKLDSFGQFPEYARVLVKLSHLYQETGRVQERERIDSQLRARFAAADQEYFVVRYLHGDDTRAVRGPEVASAKAITPY
jgi:tetratricopeptide (TPR) repeat protein